MAYQLLNSFSSGDIVSFSHMNANMSNFTEIASGSPGAPDIHWSAFNYMVETSGLLSLSSGWNMFEDVGTNDWFGINSYSIVRGQSSAEMGDGIYQLFQSSDQTAAQPVHFGFRWGSSGFYVASYFAATNGHSLKMIDTGHIMLYCSSCAADFTLQFQKYSINTPPNQWQPLVFANAERYTTIRHNAMLENFRAFCQGASGSPKFTSDVIHYSPESVNARSWGSGFYLSPQIGFHTMTWKAGHVSHYIVPEFYVNDANSGAVWIRQPIANDDCFGLICQASGGSVRYWPTANSAYYADISFSIQNSRGFGYDGTLTEYGHAGVASDFNSLGNNFEFMCDGGGETSGTPVRPYVDFSKALYHANSPVYGEAHVPPSTHWLVPTGLYWFWRDINNNRLAYEFYDGATWWRQSSITTAAYAFPTMLYSTGSHHRVKNLSGVSTGTLIYFGY